MNAARAFAARLIRGTTSAERGCNRDYRILKFDFDSPAKALAIGSSQSISIGCLWDRPAYMYTRLHVMTNVRNGISHGVWRGRLPLPHLATSPCFRFRPE